MRKTSRCTPVITCEHGFPLTNERLLFERLAMEIMQAGLSWTIVLKKRRALNKAFDRFSVTKVAAIKRSIKRLLADSSIIRNRRKIEAITENANGFCRIRRTHKALRAGWRRITREARPNGSSSSATFVFMGEEIVNEFPEVGINCFPVRTERITQFISKFKVMRFGKENLKPGRLAGRWWRLP